MATVSIRIQKSDFLDIVELLTMIVRTCAKVSLADSKFLVYGDLAEIEILSIARKEITSSGKPLVTGIASI